MNELVEKVISQWTISCV